MGNIWGHRRMKNCCKKALGKLDRARALGRCVAGGLSAPKSAQETGRATAETLESKLGSLPIPLAKASLEGLYASQSDLVRLDPSARKIWEEIASQHGEVHIAAGETREAQFWDVLASPPELIDLCGATDIHDQLANRLSGKTFHLGGEHDPLGQGVLKRLRDATGNKLDLKGRRVLFKIKTLDNGAEVWIGAGQLHTPSDEHPYGVSIDVLRW